MTALITARGLNRVFTSAAGAVHATVDVDLDVHAGQLVVVRGASGAGKTTLLNLIGLLDRPTSGTIVIDGVDAVGRSEDELAALRRDHLGFVFQSFGLIPVLSAAENVELPLRIAGVAAAERDARVAAALDLVGLGGHAEQRPAELSGGQQQRVGIARAIVSRPRILIADEPTGQLDSRTAATIMDLISELVATEGLAAIVSTHDPLMVQRAHRVIDVHDGRVTHDTANHTPNDTADDTAAAAIVEGDAPAAPLTRAQLRAMREGR